MKHIARILAALLAFLPVAAGAQQFQNIPSGTVIGRSQIGSGPAQPIPFSQLMALIGNVNTGTVTASSVVYKGSTSGQATIGAQAVAGTPTIKWPTTSGTVSTTATTPILLDAVTGIISCPSCLTSVSGGIPIISTRTLAASQNLSTLSAIRTLGYASAGDGGGATFKNVGSAAFLDSGIVTGSYTPTAGGIGYTNGTYYGVFLTGGTGTNAQANITVSGGAVSNVTVTGTGGNAYTVGDVLSAAAANVGGTGSGFTWTVPTVTTPLASFTDSAGTHWQYITDLGNFPNIRQFGAKQNYTAAGGDGAATNDQPAIQAALNFASYGIGSGDAGGFSGQTVIVPAGASLVCGGLMLPTHVGLRGVSEVGATLKECDAEAATQNFITLGDPLNHQTSFFTTLEKLTLFGTSSAISGTVAMVMTVSAQGDIIRDVSIYPLTRGCAYSSIGYGGPSMLHIYNLYCVPNNTLTPFGVSLNSASVHLIDGGTWFSSGGTPWGGDAIIVQGGLINNIFDVHCENMAVCAYVNVAAGLPAQTHISGMIGNATVSTMIVRPTGTASGQLKVEHSLPNGASCTVLNNGSCATTSPIVADTIY